MGAFVHFFKFGLAHRIVTLTLLIIVVGIGLLTTSILYVAGQKSQVRIEQIGNETLSVAKASLAQPLWTFNDPALMSLVDAMVSQSSGFTRGIRVFNKEGRLMYQKVAEDSLEIEELLLNPYASLMSSAIVYEGEVVGKVDLVVSSETFQKDAHDIIKITLLVIAVTTVILSLFVLLTVAKLLSEPLEQMVKGVQLIEQADYKSSFSERYKYELGELSRAFNKAVHAIRDRDKQLHEYASNLEKKVEERTRQVEDQKEKALNASRMAALGAMAGGVAHEVNNPLAIIEGKVFMAKRAYELGQGKDQVFSHLDRIILMVKRVAAIVNDLRIFASDGSGEFAIECSAHDIVASVANLISARLDRKSIRFTCKVEPIDLMIQVKKSQIVQVLMNLIGNSEDAVESLSEKWISLEIIKLEEAVEISVTDSGKGISAEVQDKMMLPFFTTKEIGKGVGLGLSASLGIVKSHGSELVYDKDSSNTRFYFRLNTSSASSNSLRNSDLKSA